jgi:hypothetical protein
MVVARKSQKPFGDFTQPRRHVFDSVLKHGWPSAPSHGATMAEKKLFKTTHHSLLSLRHAH